MLSSTPENNQSRKRKHTDVDTQSCSLLSGSQEELAAVGPRIIYDHGSADPKSHAAKDPLTFSMNTSELEEAHPEAIRKISRASDRCATELRNKSSWVMKVAFPLLGEAIGDLPLECWSVEEDCVEPEYALQYTAPGLGPYSNKVDLVIELPTEQWKELYDRAGINVYGKQLSHSYDATAGKRFLGPGIMVKARDGNRMEAQVQLGVWLSGLVMWAFKNRSRQAHPPPLIGCIAIGEDWRFYIIYAVEGASGNLDEVRVWGPLIDLNSSTANEKQTVVLVRTLRRAMGYTRGPFIEGLLESMGVPKP